MQPQILVIYFAILTENWSLAILSGVIYSSCTPMASSHIFLSLALFYCRSFMSYCLNCKSGWQKQSSLWGELSTASGALSKGTFSRTFITLYDSPISSDKKDESCEGFIDGDIIESFLDLDRWCLNIFGNPIQSEHLSFLQCECSLHIQLSRVSMTDVVTGLQRADSSGMKVDNDDGCISWTILCNPRWQSVLTTSSKLWRTSQGSTRHAHCICWQRSPRFCH